MVDEIVFLDLDVRITNDCQVTAFCLDLSVHLCDIFGREVLWVELEVLIPVLFAILLGPFDVHDEHVDREVVVGKVLVTLHNDLS